MMREAGDSWEEAIWNVSILDLTLLVIDFETVTPKGRPPEPIELAAMRVGSGLRVDESFRFDRLIAPPAGAPLTAFDTEQTGITTEMLRGCPSASTVLSELDAAVGGTVHIAAAHNARYELAIVKRFPDVTSMLRRASWIDTVALAKHLLPDLPSYRLDGLAQEYSLPIPSDRHRALPDVELTVSLLLKLLERGWKSGEARKAGDLIRVAGIGIRPPEQRSLFGDA